MSVAGINVLVEETRAAAAAAPLLSVRGVKTFYGNIIALKDPLDQNGRPKRDTANTDPRMRTRSIVGLPFVTGFKAAGRDSWTGGKIYNPGDGKTYASRMALNRDGTLKVSGCVLVICQNQTWTRAPR